MVRAGSGCGGKIIYFGVGNTTTGLKKFSDGAITTVLPQDSSTIYVLVFGDTSFLPDEHALYAAGSIVTSSHTLYSGVARRVQNGWQAVAVNNLGGAQRALSIHSSLALGAPGTSVAGGALTLTQAEFASINTPVARFDRVRWQPLGSNLSGTARTLFSLEGKLDESGTLTAVSAGGGGTEGHVAYAALIAHVAFGVLQSAGGLLAPIAVLAGALIIITLHVVAGGREVSQDHRSTAAQGNWISVGQLADIPTNRAKIVKAPGGERIAVFAHGGTISAVTNVCAHQGGPLGEGKIINGCITCPWHGWQYQPGDGCSPPPFNERIKTYQVRFKGTQVEVNRDPLPLGTASSPIGSPITQGTVSN